MDVSLESNRGKKRQLKYGVKEGYKGSTIGGPCNLGYIWSKLDQDFGFYLRINDIIMYYKCWVIDEFRESGEVF